MGYSITKALLLLFPLFIFIPDTLSAEDSGVIEKEDVIIHFPMTLRNAAEQLGDVYPGLKADLERTFEWRLNTKPIIVLTKDSKTFQQIVGNNIIAAYALPQRNLIIIDYSKMKMPPFTVESTVKHELCHLLLHHHIRGDLLPRWLDEGIAQWVSDGIAEIMIERKRSVLTEAMLSGKHIPIRFLADGFPEDRDSLLLAYEESKDFVEYIRKKYGDEGIMRVLRNLERGDTIQEAILKALSIPFGQLEHEWLKHLRRKATWFSYLSRNLYEILFVVAAILTILGFIRILMKRRALKDEEWGD